MGAYMVVLSDVLLKLSVLSDVLIPCMCSECVVCTLQI